MAAESSGATFFRGDLHIHSHGASYDCLDADATPEAIVAAARREGMAIISIADHNEIGNVRAAVAAGQSAGVLVIPAVELSTPEGHLLCYAPTPDALERFFNRLDIADRGTDNCRCQTGTFQCLREIEAVGGFAILAHIDSAGAFEANVARFTPAKLDILSHRALEGFEVARADCEYLYSDRDVSTNRRNAAQTRIERLKLGSQQFLARIQNSDSHTLNAIGRNAQSDRRVTRYKMEAPSFEGLRLALRSADTRVRMEEGLPSTVPIIDRVTFQGGFLNGQAVTFSPNLTCIIGGRGSGKSTAFESVCLLAGAADPDIDVIDSDVWPDLLTLVYRDGTAHRHVLARSKGSEMENLDDPITGSTIFPIESYRQGATNDISKRVHGDPLALLNFLDKLVPVEGAIADEDELRAELNKIAPDVAKAVATVAKIPTYEQELKLKSAQLQRLRDDKAEDIIKLQQRLESERIARSAIETALGKLTGAVLSSAITTVTSDIREATEDSLIEIGLPEATQIRTDTDSYERAVDGSTTALRSVTGTYVTGVRAQIATWKAKEGKTSGEIEQKKQELLKLGIRLDMPFIQKTAADEARARENLRIVKTWVPELARLRKEHAGLLARRWAARNKVSGLRVAFAARASAALKSTLSDLSVSLKIDADALSPTAERLINEVMNWRTLQQLKAKALISDLTLPKVLECVRRKDTKPIAGLRDEKQQTIFSAAEAGTLLDRLADAELLAKLEAVAVHDRPRLSVTKRIEGAGGTPSFRPRDFKKLSLGQQQSVLLALMLTSESNAPLIVDQPEDNLDSEFIYKTLVPVIRAAKERRQVIVVTHNANIAVLGDAELIVALKATNDKGTIVTRGSIDHKPTCDLACDILEGSREAFDRRAMVYGIASRA